MKYRTFKREHIVDGSVISYDYLVKRKFLWRWWWVMEYRGGRRGGKQRKSFNNLQDADLWIRGQKIEERITEVKDVRDKAEAK